MNTQTALVTGASSGIGKALANELARKGFNIVGVADNDAKLDMAMSELRLQHGVNTLEIVKDLTGPTAPQEIYNELQERGIVVDVLVNDAGVGQGGAFFESSLERDLYLIQLNMASVTQLTKLFLRDMLRRNAGRILNVGSIAGFQPGPLMAVYHATKAYVNSFSESLAEELKDTEVTVTLLCPGPTDTNFFHVADIEESRVYESGVLMPPEKVAEIAIGAMLNGERVIVPGIGNKVMTFTRRLMPLSLQAKFNKKLYEVNEESSAELYPP